MFIIDSLIVQSYIFLSQNAIDIYLFDITILTIISYCYINEDNTL